MAMTITILPDSQDVWGKHRAIVADCAGDNSYGTGGYALTAAQFGMRQIYGMKKIGGNGPGGTVEAHWRTDTAKLQIMYPTGGGTIPAALAAPLITSGAVAMTSTAANGAADITAGQAAEVAAATNLTTVTVRMLVIGE